MKIEPGRIVPLGYGKFVRSDRIVGLEPIEDQRGPGRRTLVYVEGKAEPIVASRSEGAILRDMTQSDEGGPGMEEQRQLLRDVLDTIDSLDPALRGMIRDQAGWNLDLIEERIRYVLGDQSE